MVKSDDSQTRFALRSILGIEHSTNLNISELLHRTLQNLVSVESFDDIKIDTVESLLFDSSSPFMTTDNARAANIAKIVENFITEDLNMIHSC